MEAPGETEMVLLHELAHQLQYNVVEGYQRQPAWLKEGVPHLKMKEHLDERVKEVKDKPEFDNR